jgi:hypothetical protein
VQEYYCQIRERLGTLVYKEDVWWDLDHRIAQTTAAILQLMDSSGIPFLDQYEDYASVLDHVERAGSLPSSNPGRSALVAALICVSTGERERAAAFFDKAAAAAVRTKHKGFQSHVADLRTSCGM